jgi:DNA primase catalytic subunit
VTQEKIRPTTATLSVVPSEDGKAWQAQFEWDDGRVDRVLRFERKQDAEAWIRDCYPRRIE